MCTKRLLDAGRRKEKQKSSTIDTKKEFNAQIVVFQLLTIIILIIVLQPR